MKETTKEFLFEYTLRSMLIVCYPIWLLFVLLDSKSWNGFKEDALLPFKKWGRQTSSN